MYESGPNNFHREVADLLGADFYVDGPELAVVHERLEQLRAEAGVLANAAFDLEAPQALEVAHRTLYSLYADRIWRPPAELRPAEAQQSLDLVRQTLETAFRNQLARRRRELGFQPPGAAGREVFEQAALGAHPAEDPGWPEFVRERITLEAMRRMVAQRSLFYLREPDPWLYALPRLTGRPKAGLIDIMLDEYGWGRLEKMHSSVYAQLMRALELDDALDALEGDALWEYLATLNHQWMAALSPELNHRLLGTIYLTEAGSPDAMRNYLAAWSRLGVDDPHVLEFFELHVEADENHRDVALDELVLPVCEREPRAAAAIVTGIFDARALEADFAAAIARG